MAGKDEGQGSMKTSHVEIWLLIISALLGILFAVLILSVGFEFQHYIRIHYGNHVASVQDKARMHHHGTGWAVTYWDGKTYFNRGGQRCAM